MKNISKFLCGVCVISTLWTNTSCIDETFPTSIASEEQLSSSNKATEALLWAMPAFLNTYGVISSSYHFDYGYSSIMHIRDIMTEDMPIEYSGSGYDWYDPWETNKYQGENYIYSQFIWNYYWKFVQTSNSVISTIKAGTASSLQLGYLGAAYGFRALAYLDMAQMFEFLENDGTTGTNVLNLTVPIVNETTTEEEARNNPRVTRTEMAAFILDDLNKAEENIVHLTETSKTLPHLSAIYGLKARCYMWLGDYANAQTYARNAIDAADVAPMTQNECLSTTDGFNTLSCWIWGSQLIEEDDAVQSGIINWTSWMSNETVYGYAGIEPYVKINKAMYDRISDTDFRKLLWKAPEGGALEGKTPFLDSYFEEVLPEYASVKFRPAKGDYATYTVGSASAFPLMRVEEMYFIEAEAAAHQNETRGKELLESFMQTYRDEKYTCTNSDIVDEIVFQKRVELWGEGLTFYDVKRLDMPVTRGYSGTNFYDMARLNTTSRPAWMNLCIIQTEKNNNKALVGYENPDPTDVYTPWIEVE